MPKRRSEPRPQARLRQSLLPQSVLDRVGGGLPRDLIGPRPYRVNLWNLIRCGIRLSAPSRRFLSSS